MLVKANPRQVGLVVDLPKSFDLLTWDRKALWTHYPDDHIGRPKGQAHAFKGMHKHEVGHMGRTRLVQNFSAVTGACLLVKRSLYNEVGGFDADNLAIAFNDVDFCLKLLQAGYRNVYTPFAQLYHYESLTRGADDTPEKQQRFTKECQNLSPCFIAMKPQMSIEIMTVTMLAAI